MPCKQYLPPIKFPTITIVVIHIIRRRINFYYIFLKNCTTFIIKNESSHFLKYSYQSVKILRKIKNLKILWHLISQIYLTILICQILIKQLIQISQNIKISSIFLNFNEFYEQKQSFTSELKNIFTKSRISIRQLYFKLTC